MARCQGRGHPHLNGATAAINGGGSQCSNTKKGKMLDEETANMASDLFAMNRETFFPVVVWRAV